MAAATLTAATSDRREKLGFFSKKRSSDADRERQAASEPFIADDQTMARVAELMRMFNNAVGNDAMLRTTAKGISSAAGLRDFEQFLGGNTPAEVWLERPWKMLVAVALRAAQSGDHILAARIFGFTSYWDLAIAPQLGHGDFFDLLLTGSPPAIEVEIATVAFGSLQQLPDNQVIFANATESVTAGDLTRVAANLLVQAPEKGIPVDNVVMLEALVRLGAGGIT